MKSMCTHSPLSLVWATRQSASRVTLSVTRGVAQGGPTWATNALAAEYSPVNRRRPWPARSLEMGRWMAPCTRGAPASTRPAYGAFR